MKKISLTLKQQQHAVGDLCASVCGFSTTTTTLPDGRVTSDFETAARAISQRHAVLYGKAPKKHEERAKADGHVDKFNVDWAGVKAKLGTDEQTLSESEMFILRALCDFAELVLLGVETAELGKEWEANIKLVNDIGNAAVKAAAEKPAA